MKIFTLTAILVSLALFSHAQQANFNWVIDTIASDNTLKGMTLNADDGSSLIIGYGNTFLQSTDHGLKWNDKSMLHPEYDFTGMSKGGETLFLSSRRSKIVDNPSAGYSDVYVTGVLLMSEDWGINWKSVSLGTMGSGTDASLNPNAKGAYAKDVYTVGAFNKDTFAVYTGWYDITSGKQTSRGGVFRTNDGGTTWTTLASNLGSNFITSIEMADSVCIVGGRYHLFINNLYTNSITDIYPNLALGTDSDLYVNSVTVLNAKEFYVTTTADGIFRTENAGQTFTKLSGLTSGANDLCVINDSVMVALGSSAKSKYTVDQGATWMDCYPGATCYKIGGVLGDTLYGLAKSVAYKCAVSDFIAKTPRWTTVDMFDNENLQKMCIISGSKAVISGLGQNCKFTSDGGLTWQSSTMPAEFEEDVDIDFNDISARNATAYTTVRRFKIADLAAIDSVQDLWMEGLLIKTTNNWETATIVDASKIGTNEGNDHTRNPQLEGCWGFNPYTVECVDANTVYLYANWYEDVTEGTKKDRSRVFKTADGGASWTVITPDFGTSYVTDIKFSGDTGYIAGNNILLKTVDAGQTTIDLYPALTLANGGDNAIYIGSIYMAGTNEIYLATTSDGVLYTMDGGSTFMKFNGISGTSDVKKLDQNSFLMMGTTSKSKFTNDGGLTWQNPAAGITTYSIGEILNDSLYVLAKGVVLKIALADLDLQTSIPLTLLNEGLQVVYSPATVDVISAEKEISRIELYSINGKMISVNEPNNRIFRYTSSAYQPGLYIVRSLVDGKMYSNKIAFR